MLIGIGKLSMNWTTGAVGVQPLQFQLLGAGIFRAGGPYLPWIVSVSLPIGAIAAQFKLWRRRRHPPSESPAAAQLSVKDLEAVT